MGRTPWFLIRKHLWDHKFRSLLTTGALAVSIFLFCVLMSVITSLNSAVDQASTSRVVVQSSVSLFVDLPQDYQQKIRSVPGVEEASKFNWFGGFYKEQSNMFAQFAIDHEIFFNLYSKDMKIVDGPKGPGPTAQDDALEAFQQERRAAVLGVDTAKKYGWKVGDTIPLIPTLYTKADQSEWEFVLVGTYEPQRSNMDRTTMFFRFDYLDETMRAQPEGKPVGVGTFSVNVVPGYPPEEVIAGIDALFVNGPQRTKTSTEAAFQAGFVSMMGNVPFFFGAIGGSILVAVLFSVINTMCIAARQRIHDVGILQALGFRRNVMIKLLLGESLVLTLLGGGLGLLLAVGVTAGLRPMFATIIPNMRIEPQTMLWAGVITLAIGLIAGLGPGLTIVRQRATDALRSV